MKLIEKEYVSKSVKKCMNCGREIQEDEFSRDLYGSRFCSDMCRQDYFAGAGKNKK